MSEKPTYGHFHTTVIIDSLQENASGNNIERVMNFDQITQIDMVSWGFYITDCREQEIGRATFVDQLPSARFEFVGDDDTPAPPPKLIDVEVSTYFSLLPRSGSKNIMDNIMESPNQLSYSNFCQITALRIPSNLRGSHNYRAQLLVYPRPNKTVSTITVNTQVKRDTKWIRLLSTRSATLLELGLVCFKY